MIYEYNDGAKWNKKWQLYFIHALINIQLRSVKCRARFFFLLVDCLMRSFLAAASNSVIMRLFNLEHWLPVSTSLFRTWIAFGLLLNCRTIHQIFKSNRKRNINWKSLFTGMRLTSLAIRKEFLSYNSELPHHNVPRLVYAVSLLPCWIFFSFFSSFNSNWKFQ